ncbi:thymidine kinase [Natroniella sulfidigena]|uniref:thymidine kinase n=1 Tax=Natroniella sulfidigena TaxID=723921 RepID=UPI00200A61E1|nr:thymidine kinase [Natroniella sulfidigena]MCK8816676.1 thymidine kinase [Natroniella sulfidigena]
MHGYYGAVKTGWLEVITGVMFSGKSSELIRRVERAMIAQQNIVVFKPRLDKRYSETEVATHNGITIKAQIVDSVAEIKQRVEEHSKKSKLDVIAIDEGQFFSNNLVQLADQLTEEGYRVIIAGLDTDFAGRGFEPIPELMARAEYVTKLHAVCVKCSNPATRNQRLINGEPASINDPIVVVGAGVDNEAEEKEEYYEARCRSCHQIRYD